MSSNSGEEGVNLSEDAQQIFQNTPLHAFKSGWDTADIAAAGDFWQVARGIASKIGTKANQLHLLVNGRVSGSCDDGLRQLVGPVTSDTFAAEDFSTLEAYEYRKRVSSVVDLLRTMYQDLQTFDR